MKFQVTMKDPDALDDAIREAAQESVANLTLDLDEREAVEERRREKAAEQCRKWFQHGEYLRVEVDTDAGTCTVIEAGK